MPGLFDDVPMAAEAAPAEKPTARPGPFDDVPMAKPQAAEPSALARAGAVAKDVGQSLASGVVRGAAGLAALPNLGVRGAEWAAGQVINRAAHAAGIKTNSDLGIDTRSGIADGLPTQEQMLRPVEGVLHKPETTAGEFAQTVGEFVPGAGAAPAKLLKFAVAPALASEAAGRAVKDTAAEPWVRGGVALATGAGAGMVGRASAADRIAARAVEGLTPAQMTQAESLVSDAAARGVTLSWPEAIQQVSGPNRLGDLQRVVEGQGGMSDFYAQRPAQVESAGRAALDTIADSGSLPSRVGGAVQDAARAGVAATPQGQAVIRATQAAGPRVSPDQAGRVIQPELRRVLDARQAAREQQAAVDYGAARGAPENVGVERTITVERPGEPVVTPQEYARPQFGDTAPRPLERFTADAPDAAPGPESLARFVAKRGGIALDGDARATDLHRYNIPGLGNVARADGKSIDNFWRERLIEAGYLRPDADGGAARDITNDLLRKLQNEQRGFPSYPIGTQGQQVGRQTVGRQSDEFKNAVSMAESRLDEDLTKVGVDPKSLHPDIRERVLGSMIRGEHADPLDAVEAVVGGIKENPAPLVKSTTIQERIPDVRFGQVNPQRALDVIDAQMRTAKGDVLSDLAQVRKDLFGPGGETDLSVEGLLHARERLDNRITAAQDVGDSTKVRDLTTARRALDGELKAVPEVATADANFAANSRPLEPFGGNTPLGRAVQQDPRTLRMATPAEQVPASLQGATAAREFLANATPEARRAFEGRQITRIMDEAGPSAEDLRSAMRQNEDLLAQLPGARDRLSSVAAARHGLAAVERSPLGRIAERPDVKNAIAALFPAKPLPGSAQEVTTAVSALSRSNPRAARDLVRMHVENVFDEATQRLQSGPNQMGGAKFAAVLRGNRQQAESLSAGLRALPGGQAIDAGFSRLLDIMEATGQRQVGGSKTTFNTEAIAELRKRGLVGEAGAAAATGGFKLPSRIMNRLDDWQAGKNVDALARLFTTPEGGRRLAQLASAKPGASTIALIDRLVLLSAHGAQSAAP